MARSLAYSHYSRYSLNLRGRPSRRSVVPIVRATLTPGRTPHVGIPSNPSITSSVRAGLELEARA